MRNAGNGDFLCCAEEVSRVAAEAADRESDFMASLKESEDEFPLFSLVAQAAEVAEDYEDDEECGTQVTWTFYVVRRS